MDQAETWHAGRPRPRTHCVRWGSSSPPKGVQPPIFGAYLLRPNGCMNQDAIWYGGRRLCVRWGPRSPSPKGCGAPKFSAHDYCGQTAGWIKMVLGMEVGLSPGDCVTWGPSHLSKKEAQPPPQVLAHFCSGQTARCIKMPLGMEAGLSPGPGDFVFDWDPAIAPPNCRPVYCGQMAGWIKMALSMEVGLSPGDFVLNGDPAPFPKKGAEPPPQFSAHFYCGHAAGCIKMSLGMEIGLRPRDFVFDGDPVPSPKRGRPSPPIYGPCLLRSNG